MKDNVVGGNQEYKAIGIREFDYKLFEEEEGGGVQEGIDGYPYLKHLIELCPGIYIQNLSKMNKEISERNQHQKELGKR